MQRLRNDPAITPLIEALSSDGLELQEESGQSGATRYLISGGKLASKELLRRHGGKWDRDLQGWTFASFEPIRELAATLLASGHTPARGLADAPVAYQQAARSFRSLRKAAQNAGHRNRLRQRFLEAGAEALPDYELLELLLFFSIDAADTKPLAKELLERYGSLGMMLKAEPSQLVEFHDLSKHDADIDAYLAYRLSDDFERDLDAEPNGMSEAGRRMQALEAAKQADSVQARDWHFEQMRLWRRRETLILFRIVQEVLQRVLREKIRERPVINSWTALIEYLQVALKHEPIEQFRVLFLDRKNSLIRDEVKQRGTVDHTPLYPREITRRALELYASAIIMVQHHPSGDPTPSRADIEMTKQLIQALNALGISVHDHVIVGKNRHTSFKSQRLM